MLVAVMNQKGGVGKTTSSINVAVALSKSGKKVLLVDFDPQSSTTKGLGKEHEVRKNLFEIINNELDPKTFIIRNVEDNLDMIGNSFNLNNSDDYEIKKYEKIRGFFSNLPAYDFIIIDCAATLGTTNIEILKSVEGVLIPTISDPFSIESITNLLATIRKVQVEFNKKLEIIGFIVTMFDRKSLVANEQVINLYKAFGSKVLKPYIPRDINVIKSNVVKKSVISYDSWSPSSKAYIELSKELTK
jgi:chromosome partitioning protein